jgi:aryl-alcohol dehydrogenase-like predicted oxidoreductase
VRVGLAGAAEAVQAGQAKALLAEAPDLAQQVEACTTSLNAALKVKARVEHRLGEQLAKTVKRGGDRKSKGQADSLIPQELGDTSDKRQNTSKRAQKLARVPWRDQERTPAAWALAFLREQRPVEVRAEAA